MGNFSFQNIYRLSAGAVLAAIALCGCFGQKDRFDSENRPTFSHYLGVGTANYAPPYGWDGQTSTGTINASINVAFLRAIDALKALKFEVRDENAKLQSGSARIQATKDDKTTALLTFDSQAEGATTVNVKIGSVGDRTGGERVLDDIQKLSRKRK